MAGHSKWANIQHRKGAQDAKRAKIFTKFIREITVSARIGGPDPDANPRLRAVVDKALTANMSREVIERAIKRGAGGEEGANLEEITYEGYAPGGVAVMIEATSDNRNRTVADVRHALSKNGGNLGQDGSVSFLFSHKGQIVLATGADEEEVMEVALEAGAEDIQTQQDGCIEVTTALEDFLAVKKALNDAGFVIERADTLMIPATYIDVDDIETAKKIVKMIDMLEDLDDVQKVHTNMSFSDAVLAELEGD